MAIMLAHPLSKCEMADLNLQSQSQVALGGGGSKCLKLYVSCATGPSKH